jgi:hypothetical protein
LIHPLPVLDYSDLLAFIARILPSHVTDGWTGGGSATYAAYSRQFERLAQRVAEYAESALILQATGEARAVGLVQLNRDDTTERVGWKAGQVFCQTRWGIRYEAVEDVEFGVGVATLTDVPARAELSGFDANVDARDIARWALPTGADRKEQIDWLSGVTESAKDTFLAEVDLGFDWRQLDPTLDAAWVHATTAFVGGALATLDVLGNERGLPRLEGEGDVAYRRRIRTLPDVLTPGAIRRAVADYLAGTGATFELLEPWEYGWTVKDDPRGTIGVYGPAKVPSFLIVVSGLLYEATGYAPGIDPNGEIGATPIGVGDQAHDGIIAGLEDLLRRIRAAGVCSKVVIAT